MKQKKAMTQQVIFYILMSILMIGIIVFGISKMLTVQDTLSEVERIELKKTLENAINYCESPINRGGIETVTLDSSKFESFCLVGLDDSIYFDKEGDFLLEDSFRDELSALKNSNRNVVALNMDFVEINNKYVLTDYFIVDSLKIETDFQSSLCFINLENEIKPEYLIKCEG